jgi:hypothetical protein
MATVPTTNGYDITALFYDQRPPSGWPAFYITGSATVQATEEMLTAYPQCLRIDQSPTITGIDTTADYFDVENMAITVAELPDIIADAILDYQEGVRPGQRWPAVYCSRDDPTYGVTPVCNALDNAGLGGAGVGLVIADWNNNYTQALNEVAASVPGPNNPFPVVGRQYQNAGPYDLDVFSLDWINTVAATPKAPPGQWLNAEAWTWTDAAIIGTGTDGVLYEWIYNPTTGEWTQLKPFSASGESRV